MHVTHYARRSAVAALLTLGLAGCAKDSSAPAPFDPQGTAADMAAAHDAFASGPSASFAAVGTDISAVLGGSALAQSPALLLSPRSKATVTYARRIASLVPKSGPGLQASLAAIPAELAGVTYVWDESADVYVASDLTGAPATGVRFLLYAVDPVLLRPVEPVVETGYVDIIDQSTASLTDVRVRVVQANVTYLEYDVVASATGSNGLVTVSGYAYNGSVRANFTLKNSITDGSSGLVLSLDYKLTVPARTLAIDWTATFANISDTDVAVTLDLAISGPNGDLRLVGTYAATGGTFTVKVNGDTFATVTITSGDPVITGAGGSPLTLDEQDAMQAVLDSYEGSLDAFAELLMPIS